MISNVLDTHHHLYHSFPPRLEMTLLTSPHDLALAIFFSILSCGFGTKSSLVALLSASLERSSVFVVLTSIFVL